MPEQSPVAIVLQCHKCHKRLRYTGAKQYIACPGCGESIPVHDNIQDNEHVVLTPPRQSPSKTSGLNLDKKAEFAKIDWNKLGTNLESTVRQTTNKLKGLPRFPTILTGIWSIWFCAILFIFLTLMNTGERFGDSAVLVGNNVFSRGKWISMCVESSIYFAMATAFLAMILSTIAYFWVGALEAKRN